MPLAERLEFHTSRPPTSGRARGSAGGDPADQRDAGAMFQETFATVQEHFLGTFDRLFPA